MLTGVVVSTTSEMSPTTVKTTTAIVTHTTTQFLTTTSVCPIENGMEKPLLITDDMITTIPATDDHAVLRTSPGWVVSPTDSPVVEISLVSNSNTTIPLVMKVGIWFSNGH